MNRILSRPRSFGLVCGAAAVALGMAYMVAAGAPIEYLAVNLAALVLGATAWLAFSGIARGNLAGAGPVVIALALSLLLTALSGVVVEGASRWVMVGPLTLQVSLIVVPLMVVLFARRPDVAGTAGMVIAALALAAQPDRAMAGALAASLLALSVAERSRLVTTALAAAVSAFGWTLLMPDALPAVPHVERVFYTAFDVHMLAGLAVVVGAALLVAPAATGWSRGSGAGPTLLAFGACWLAVVVAAALGNYPTPLVGYGGSAVLGYLLSVALLPTCVDELGRSGATESKSRFDSTSGRIDMERRLRVNAAP